MDHQYGENGARNIAFHINQIIPYGPFHRLMYEAFKILEKCWSFLYLNFTTQYCSSTLPVHAYKMVITTVCVQIDNRVCST